MVGADVDAQLRNHKESVETPKEIVRRTIFGVYYRPGNPGAWRV
jgi:hypothetical protein